MDGQRTKGSEEVRVELLWYVCKEEIEIQRTGTSTEKSSKKNGGLAIGKSDWGMISMEMKRCFGKR